MEKYNLIQTGEEVQRILNEAVPQSEITAEVERAQGAEQTLQDNIDAEELRAKAAEQQNADDIDAIENIIPNDASSNNKLVTESDLNSEVGDLEQADTVLQGNIEAEELRAKAAEKQNADDIDVIEEKIPTEASSSNQLADKAFVNSSIASNTATYRGSFNQVNDLHLTLEATEADIATALASAIDDADNNDYCYLQVPVSESAPTEIAQVDRYKYNGTTWAYEYTLNNSGFTADQWAALNSAITSGLVAKLSALPNMTELTALLAGKQNLLNFDTAPTTGSNNPVTSGGVKTAIDDEKTRAQAAEQANNLLITQINGKIPSDATSENKLVDKAYVDAADATMQSAIEGILALIPEAATALNQLADKAFVNSSIATNTGTFKGTYNVVLDLELFYDATQAQIALMLASKISSAKNNDYCYVQVPNSNETPTSINHTDRYKYNGTAWAYEYTLNNSGYTSDQWGAINSGITSALVTSLTNLLNNLVPSTATAQNKLADQAYVIAAIVAAIPACKGTFTTLSDLEAVASPKAGDLGIVRTTDSNGYTVYTFYQYINNAWTVFFEINHQLINKPASDNTELATFDNGMGKYEIPKHIVNIGTELEPIYQNQLHQSDFQINGASRTNTIYVIKYDFTLAEDITIPANCVLEFDGGSISGMYNLTGTNTGINAELVKIFSTDVTVAGSWNVAEAYTEWFGAKGDGTTDDAEAIQKTIDFAYDGGVVNVRLLAKEYLISVPIIVWGGNDDTDSTSSQPIQKKVNLIGTSKRSTKITKKNNTASTLNDNAVDAIIIVAAGRYKDGYTSPSTESDPLIIAFGNCIKNITICGLSNNYRGYGIYSLGLMYCGIENVNVFYCTNGLYTKTWNCYNHFHDIGCTLCANGFNFGETHIGGNTTMNFKNCHINGCSITGFKLIGSGVLENCSCDGGRCDAIHLTRYVRPDVIIKAEFFVEKFHHESQTGRLLYNDGGNITFMKGSGEIGPSGSLTTSYIEGINKSKTIFTDQKFSMRFDNQNLKGIKVYNIDATSLLFVNDEIVPNFLFEQYTKINYNSRIKELVNPLSDYITFTPYYSVGESGEFSTLNVNSIDNSLECIYEKKDRTNLEAVEFDKKYKFEKGGKIIVGLSVEKVQGDISNGDSISLGLYDTLYEQGYRSMNALIGTYYNPDAVVSNYYWNVTKEMVVFDVSEVEGEYYIGFGMVNTGKRKITIYDVYYVK